MQGTTPGKKGERPLRVGIINLMPRLEHYEPNLQAWLAAACVPVAPVWIRLASHVYRSSDPAHLARHYCTFEQAIAEGPLDGLILTGAPVEHLPLDEVRYWPELSAILEQAVRTLAGTLGVCFGAMVLGEREGLQRVLHARKVSGVYEHRVAKAGAMLLGLEPQGFHCPHSRFAGFTREDVAQAESEGRVVLLADSVEAGPTLLATPDGRVVMHLGHPEYDVTRLGEEWRRDVALGRTDVDSPRNYDGDASVPLVDWRADSAAFLRAWLCYLLDHGRQRSVTAAVGASALSSDACNLR